MYVSVVTYTYFEQRSAPPDIEVELFMVLSEGLSVRINGERLVKAEKEIGSFGGNQTTRIERKTERAEQA